MRLLTTSLLIIGSFSSGLLQAEAKTAPMTSAPLTLVTVNGHAITADYFRKYFENTDLERMDGQEQAQALDELIKIKLLSSLAEKQKLTDLYEVKLALKVKRDEYLTNLILAQHLQKNPITETEINAIYQEKYVSDSVEYQLSHILLETKEQANIIIDKLNAGADFATIAKAESIDGGNQGGDLGWLGKDSMPASFQQALSQLKKQSLHPTPVTSDYGWHVLKLGDKRPVAPAPLEQVVEEIEQNIQKLRINRYLNEIRETASIEFNPELMQKPLKTQ